jgi:hypothetical protein
LWVVLVVAGCCWLLLVVADCCWLLLVFVGCCLLLLVFVGTSTTAATTTINRSHFGSQTLLGLSASMLPNLSRLWAPLRLPEPRRRGGWRQRLAAEEEPVQPAAGAPISRLFGEHLQDWGDGLISAQKLQRLASHGVADGFRHPMLERLASVPAGQHAELGLHRLLETCGVPQQLTEYPGEFVSHALLPSTWIRLIHSGYPHEFRLRFGAEKHKVAAFWEAFLGRAANQGVARDHPVVGGKTPAEL